MKTPAFVLTLISLLACSSYCASAQDVNSFTQFHIYSSHTSFPDTGRRLGHIYDKKLYAAKEYYSDSTVLIIVPKGLNAAKKVDLVFWFHGWGNNVDSAAIRYELTEQFVASKRNAVLVLAEAARNAPDSYGGKLENLGTFKLLVADVLRGLSEKKLISQNCAAGHILLAGHSGAYRVMARILKNGQMPVDEVMLFDALYAETDTYLDWIKGDKSHRFIDIYTDHGGTLDESKKMAGMIDDADLVNFEIEETKLAPTHFDAHLVMFIHSLKEHNDVVSPDNFRLMLEHEPFLKVVKQ